MKNLSQFESMHPEAVDEAYHILNIGSISLVLYWYQFFTMIKEVPGCIVECGVGRARSLTILSSLNKIMDSVGSGGRKIYAYDSFQGFPKPSPEDDSPRKPQEGEWSRSPSGKYEYSPDFIRMVIENANMPESNDWLKLTKGFFCDSLKDFPEDEIAILHVDADLYQSYLDVLNALYQKVVTGGIIVFDDFQYVDNKGERWPGARKAVNEFFADKGQVLKQSIRGTPYIIKQ